MNSGMDCGIAVETDWRMAKWMKRGMVEGWIDNEQGNGKGTK
jgi:hypothetical protein